MRVESYTKEFYNYVAEKVTNTHTKKFFRYLAKEGEKHFLLLNNILNTLTKEAGISPKDIPSIPNGKKYSQDLSIVKDSPKLSIINVRQAIMDHIELEKNLEFEYMEIALNIELSEEIETRNLVKEIKSQLMKLSKTERRHHEQLKALVKIWKS